MTSSPLRAGDWVEVRSKEEILATLDANGCIDGLPFMPEMLQYCGKRFRVFKRAHKTCDTVNKTGGRRVASAVHLDELRCDGSGHGGCQAGCLLFWKDAWVRPVGGEPGRIQKNAGDQRGLSEAGLRDAAVVSRSSAGLRYRCQATELPRYSTLLSRWDMRQYWEDWRSGNERLGGMVGPFLFAVFERLMNLGVGWGGAFRWAYDRVQRWRGGQPYPRKRGCIPAGQATPSCELGLQPGERVRVRDFEEIRDTLDTNNRNKGMYFDAEEVPFCGKEFSVLRRVKRIVNEQTGEMMEFKTESVILDGVYCTARYSDRRLFCPRAIYPMWREAWLERTGRNRSGE